MNQITPDTSPIRIDPSPPGRELTLTGIGKMARELLTRENKATLIGSTSRGAFLQLPAGWVVFLSSEAFRGPLTLNLDGPFQPSALLKTGAQARLENDQILFEEAGVAILTGQAASWEASPLPQAYLPSAERLAQLSSVARLVLHRRPGSSFQSLLQAIDQETGAGGDHLLPRISSLLHSGQIAGLLAELVPLLGAGEGLTPSGDDLVIGLLLALNRWGRVLLPGLDMRALNRELVSNAYRKTTTLAANLVECASHGQADERLVQALDGLMTGIPDASTCASLLAGWGNTSGIYALAGMASVLNGKQPRAIECTIDKIG